MNIEKHGHLIMGILLIGFSFYLLLDRDEVAAPLIFTCFAFLNLHSWFTYDRKEIEKELRAKEMSEMLEKDRQEKERLCTIEAKKMEAVYARERQLRLAREREEEKQAILQKSFSYVYVLSNSSMPGIIKIGYTDNNPLSRATELSSVTAIPTPFIVEREYAFTSIKKAQKEEKRLHNVFSSHRITNNREFFRINPVQVDTKIRNNITHQYKS